MPPPSARAASIFDKIEEQHIMPRQAQNIILDKELRRDIDAIIQRLKEGIGNLSQRDDQHRGSRERSLAVTKLQEAVMWLGMDLKAINEEGGGGENPYPNSKDPSNTTIDPTADGLKL